MKETDSPEDPFFRCWAKNDCGRCLHEAGCSWCPFVRCHYDNIPTTQIADVRIAAIDTSVRPERALTPIACACVG